MIYCIHKDMGTTKGFKDWCWNNLVNSATALFKHNQLKIRLPVINVDDADKWLPVCINAIWYLKLIADLTMIRSLYYKYSYVNKSIWWSTLNVDHITWSKLLLWYANSAKYRVVTDLFKVSIFRTDHVWDWRQNMLEHVEKFKNKDNTEAY